MAGSTGEIIKSLVTNAVIASGKGVAAVVTGSGAMLAETLHSFSDCGNQLLLLLGLRQAAKPADAEHPLGYGRTLYFWSFIVSLLIFSSGGAFSIYEGIHKMQHPEPVGSIGLGVGILVFSLALEGNAAWGNLREMKKRRGDVPLMAYLRRTKDSDLVVVFGENAAAVLGLVLALGALIMARETGDGRWDGAGSLAIGIVLVGVAIFLGREVKSLLVGESADPELQKTIEQLAEVDPNVDKVLRMLTIQQGPGEVMLAAKLKFRAGLVSGGELEEAINAFERLVHDKVPEVKWCFIEPDVSD